MSVRRLAVVLLSAVAVLGACEPVEDVGAAGASAPVARPTGSLPSASSATTAAGAAKPRTVPSPAAPSSSATRKATPKPAAPTLLPVVGVSDGDTIRVRVKGVTERVRLIGIDTPELAGGECYAQKAASKMQSLVQSRSVRLVADPTQADRDRYGRLLRHVRLADGRSVAQLLIAGGYGREYTYDAAYRGQASHLAAQAAAKKARLGIWGSACAAPLPVKPGTGQGGACLIKGNIASDGEKIYHVPGQQYYDVTKISEAKGERWFCTEAQAVAAGWRRSQR